MNVQGSVAMIDQYNKLAKDYDEFGDIENYLGDEKTFFENLFDKYNTESVLDCSCGTGQHLYMISQMGKKIQGSDYSSAMLKVAEENLKKRDVDVKLTQCSFMCLEEKFKEKFDCILCLTNSLPHLLTDDDLITALTSMRNRLNEGGILVLTSGTTVKSLTQAPPIEVVINRKDFSRIFVKEIKDGIITIHIVDLYHSDARNDSNQYEIVNKILYEEDYRRLITEAGYSKINIYGGYDFAPYSKQDSMRIIVVAEK